jgi:tape measure domain-containing protein
VSFAALTIDLTAKLTNLETGMGRAVAVAERSAKKIEKAFSFSNVAKTGAAFFAGQLGLQSALAGLVKAKELTDEWTRIRVLVENVTRNLAEAGRAQAGLFAAAQATRQNYGELSRTFASFARNADELNISSDEAVRLQTTIAQAIALSGARAESAASALVQFGQGIAAGVLRGEELNSVLEQTPKLAKAIADGLGVPIGVLIKMGKDGELSADKIIKALQKIAPSLQEEFDQVTPTIADSFTALNNSIGNVLNRFNEVIPIGRALSGIILGISSALDKIVAFSRFDPQTTLQNVRAVVNERAERARENLAALEKNDQIPLARRQPFIDDARRRLQEAIAAAEQLNKRNAEQGLAPDGSPRTNLAAFEQRITDKAAKDFEKAKKRYDLLRAQLSGISNDFLNKYNELIAARDAGVISEAQFFKDLEDLKKSSGITKTPKATKEERDEIGELITQTTEKQRAAIDALRAAVVGLIDPYEELRVKLADIDRLQELGPAGGGITKDQALEARFRVQEQIQELLQARTSETTKAQDAARRSLEEWLETQKLELSLMQESEPYRQTALKLRELEVAGVERGSAAYEEFRRKLLDVNRARAVADIDANTESGKLLRTQQTLQLLVSDFESKVGRGVDPEQLSALQSRLGEQFSAVLGLDDKIKETSDSAKELGEAFASSFEKAVLGAEGFRSVLAGLGEDIIKIFLRQQITSPLAAAIGEGAKGLFGGGTLFSAIAGLFGARAEGGNVQAGSSYLVGERGPELFTAGANGRITPNSKLAGRGGPVVNNYITVSGEVSRADLMNAVSMAEQRTKDAIMQSMQRNGAFARA